jgi:NAD(P)-dependent dehydrogenase (short-subunit alcohol dehydrogenase family)
MDIQRISAAVSGGASGLGLSAARALASRGALPATAFTEKRQPVWRGR